MSFFFLSLLSPGLKKDRSAGVGLLHGSWDQDDPGHPLPSCHKLSSRPRLLVFSHNSSKKVLVKHLCACEIV